MAANAFSICFRIAVSFFVAIIRAPFSFPLRFFLCQMWKLVEKSLIKLRQIDSAKGTMRNVLLNHQNRFPLVGDFKLRQLGDRDNAKLQSKKVSEFGMVDGHY